MPRATAYPRPCLVPLIALALMVVLSALAPGRAAAAGVEKLVDPSTADGWEAYIGGGTTLSTSA